MRRSILRIACVGLALGLLSTLVVAWVVPVAFDAMRRRTPLSADRFWVDDTRGGHYQLAVDRFAAYAVFSHIIFSGAAKDLPYYKQNPPPEWVYTLLHSMKGDPPADEQPWWSVETFVCGWPLRAFGGARYEPWVPQGQPAPTFTIVDGKLVPVAPPRPRVMVVGLYRFGGAGGDRFTVPLRPMWRGLVANVLAFSAGWVGLMLVVRGGRRWNRARRGRCPDCGYDLAGVGQTCPECGRKRPRG